MFGMRGMVGEQMPQRGLHLSKTTAMVGDDAGRTKRQAQQAHATAGIFALLTVHESFLRRGNTKIEQSRRSGGFYGARKPTRCGGLGVERHRRTARRRKLITQDQCANCLNVDRGYRYGPGSILRHRRRYHGQRRTQERQQGMSHANDSQRLNPDQLTSL